MNRRKTLRPLLIGTIVTLALVFTGCPSPSGNNPGGDGSTPASTCDMLGFTILASSDASSIMTTNATGAIDGDTGTISLIVPNGTDTTTLVAAYTHNGDYVTIGSTIQSSGTTANDFTDSDTSAVLYTVVAEDGTENDYAVVVTVAPLGASTDKDITAFSADGTAGTIDESATPPSITIEVPYGPFGSEASASLEVDIVTNGDLVSPVDGAMVTFTEGDAYSFTVTAEDGSTKVYEVTVTEADNTENDITVFDLLAAENGTLDQDVTGLINPTAHSVSLEVPYGTSIAALVPDIAVSAEATVSPADGIPADFSSGDVTYTVTAEDGSTQDYSVGVTVLPNDQNNITSFRFLDSENAGDWGENYTGVIDETATPPSVTIIVPDGFDVSSLVPTLEVSPEAAVTTPADTASGVDFSGEALVSFVITAEDGGTKSYNVQVLIAPSDGKDISAFGFLDSENDGDWGDDIAGVITGTNIAISVPYGTDVTALVPDITRSAESTVSPADGAFVNFTNPVDFTVTAEDLSTQVYTVTVTVLPPEDGTITVNLTGATGSPSPEGADCGFIVVAEGADPYDAGAYLAQNSTPISGGAISVPATDDMDNPIQFTGGNTYDVYMTIDMDGDGNFGNSGDRVAMTPVQVFVHGDVTADFSYADMTVVPDTTISFSLTGAPANVDYQMLVVEDGGDPLDSIGGYGDITDGSGNAAAVALDESDPVVFPPGEYDVWLYVDDGDELINTNDRFDMVDVTITTSPETAVFTHGSMAYYSPSPGTLTIELSDAAAQNGYPFVVFVMNADDDPLDGDIPVASGSSTIAGGTAQFTTGILAGGAYDVYMFIDIDGSGTLVPSADDPAYIEMALIDGNSTRPVSYDDFEPFDDSDTLPDGSLLVVLTGGTAYTSGEFCGYSVWEGTYTAAELGTLMGLTPDGMAGGTFDEDGDFVGVAQVDPESGDYTATIFDPSTAVTIGISVDLDGNDFDDGDLFGVFNTTTEATGYSTYVLTIDDLSTFSAAP